MKKIMLLCLIVLCFAFINQIAFSQSIAIVDLSKIEQEAPLVKSIDKEIEDKGLSYKKELEIRNRFKYLTEAEVKEIIDTVEATQRIKELEAQDDSRNSELIALNQKTPLNDTEKARQTELISMSKKSEENLRNVATGFEKLFNEFAMGKQIELNNQITAATKSVVEEKGFSIALQKGAIIYGGTDITADVMAKLPASL